jgi:hypothetical protein
LSYNTGVVNFQYTPSALGDYSPKLVTLAVSLVQWVQPGADFSHIFFRVKFRGKFSPQKMLGKIGIFRGKSFEKSLFQQIPRNFPRKITFRGKKCTKN